MLAKMTPAEMDERIAAEVIEEEKRNRVIEVLKLGLAAVCAALRFPVEPAAFEPRRPQAGSEERMVTPDDGCVSPEAGAAMFVGVLGKADRRTG